MFKRILVPLDGSKRAEQAISPAARLARSADGTLIFLRVVPIVPQYAPYLATGPIIPPASAAGDIEAARQYLAEVAARDECVGIVMEQNVVVGPPAPLILDAVYERAAGAVVLCSHGRTGFARWALGSVAEHLARHAPVPVLVMHETGTQVEELGTPETQPVRVLVPLDGSALAEEALPGAMALAQAIGGAQAAMHLFMVVDFYETTPKRTPQGHALDTAKKYLAELSETLGKTSGAEQAIHITWSAVAAEDTASAILKTAERGGESEQGEPFGACAAIAMATHGRSGVARLALGSITERVLEGTRLPLCIVRARGAATGDAEAAEHAKYAPVSTGHGAVMPLRWRLP